MESSKVGSDLASEDTGQMNGEPDSDGKKTMDQSKMASDAAVSSTSKKKSTNMTVSPGKADAQDKNDDNHVVDGLKDAASPNGDVGTDCKVAADQSGKESVDTYPSGRPKRKAAMRSLSPAKVNGNMETDDDRKYSRAKKGSNKKAKTRGWNQNVGTGKNFGKVSSESMKKMSGAGHRPFVNKAKEIQALGNSLVSSVSKMKEAAANHRVADLKASNGLLNPRDVQHWKNKTMSFPGDKEVQIVGVNMAMSSNKYPAQSMVRVSASGAGSSVTRTSVSGGMQTGPSMQWMLSQRGSSMQGSGIVMATTSAPLFQAAARNIQQPQTLSHKPDSLLRSPYTGSMSMQANQFQSPYNNQNRTMATAASILSTMPEKPTSSKGMIEMIRWEVESHINIKPKYLKTNPKAELGSMAKFVFDFGFDIVKERVYHELVEIQRLRSEEGSLSDKEKNDFVKLQEIDKELNEKVGHFKYRTSKACGCGFRTELGNVKFLHRQQAHSDRNGVLRCALCKYTSRQPSTFRSHMESEHGRAGIVENRPSFYECALCPYESNNSNRLEQHQARCQRNFRENFNLHPSSVSGPEVSLCLENVFYSMFTNRFLNPTPRSVQAMTPVNTTGRVAGSSTSLVSTSSATSRVAGQYMQRTSATNNSGVSPGQSGNAFSSQSRVSHGQTKTVVPSQSRSSPMQEGAVLSTGSKQSHQPNQSNAPNQANKGFEVCEICGGYVKDRKALRIHFYFAHRMDMPLSMFERPQPPLYCATCFSRFWTAQGLQKHILSHQGDSANSSQPSSVVAGKCILCSHRVPNILLHMKMVHNREMAHYLSAKMCIFCGCRLRTLREIENHLHKMHRFVVNNIDSHLQVKAPLPSTPPVSSSSSPHPTAEASVGKSALPPPQQQPQLAAKSKGGIVAKNKCVLCNLAFTRNVDLTRHCMRAHHTCMKCGLVVVDKESLSRHSCLPCSSGMRTCHFCDESGFHPAYYIKHMRDKHLRRCSVALRRLDQAIFEAMKQPITISDSDEDEPVVKQAKLDTDDGGEPEKNGDDVESVSAEQSEAKDVTARLCERSGEILDKSDDERSGSGVEKTGKRGDDEVNKGSKELEKMSKKEEVNGNHKLDKEYAANTDGDVDGDVSNADSESRNQTQLSEEENGMMKENFVAADKHSPKRMMDKLDQGSVDSDRTSKKKIGPQDSSEGIEEHILVNGANETEDDEKHAAEEHPTKVSSRKRKSVDRYDSREEKPVQKSARRSSSKGEGVSKAD